MRRPTIVVDTNILVSALLKSDSLPSTIIKLIRADRLVWCYSPELLSEYETVLRRPELGFDPEAIDRLLRFANQSSIIVTPHARVSVSPDEPDNRFLECAEAADADYLVTGNKKHFPSHWKRTTILSARELLESIEAIAE